MERLYHVFTHGSDAWFPEPDYGEALAQFKQWATEKGSARLYEEWWESLAADDAIHEDCLLAWGPFPG